MYLIYSLSKFTFFKLDVLQNQSVKIMGFAFRNNFKSMAIE